MSDKKYGVYYHEKVKAETPIETTKESAQAFLDLAKEQGKVIEND